MTSYWRSVARPIIAKVIAEHGKDHPQIRRLISKAYPFGPREHHPYKVWCDEAKEQLGIKAAARKTVQDQSAGLFRQEVGQ